LGKGENKGLLLVTVQKTSTLRRGRRRSNKGDLHGKHLPFWKKRERGILLTPWEEKKGGPEHSGEEKKREGRRQREGPKQKLSNVRRGLSIRKKGKKTKKRNGKDFVTRPKMSPARRGDRRGTDKGMQPMA